LSRINKCDSVFHALNFIFRGLNVSIVLKSFRSFVFYRLTMSENNKVFFIINKYSGAGYRPDVEGRIITACGQLNLECVIEFTQERGHATELARHAVEQNFRTVFAVGGDGTVNEVAQGMVNTGVTMGILPKGSGNGLARHICVPMNFRKSLATLSSRQTITMDTVLVNGRLSVNVAGIGFDGHVAGLFGKNGKRGLVGYSWLVVKEFLSFGEFPLDMEVDGQRFQRSTFILAFANSSQFGNNAKVAPHASVCDQRVDVCLIKKVPLTQAIGFAQKMFNGTMDRSAFVEIIQAKKIELQFDRPMPYHIDGEAMEPQARFSIEVQPKSLRMLVPEGMNPKV
jgi:YegS/Rv2252/BmrU family lipid kinase